MLTVDDQAVFRDAARAVIAATPGFEPLAEVTSGEDALIVADRLHPDLVLLDLHLPGIDGLETSRRLAAGRPAPLVVLVSAYDHALLRDSAGGWGAAAFLPKQKLRPRVLRELWDRHAAAAAITPPG